MSRLFRILNDNETIGVVYDSKEHTSPRKQEIIRLWDTLKAVCRFSKETGISLQTAYNTGMKIMDGTERLSDDQGDVIISNYPNHGKRFYTEMKRFNRIHDIRLEQEKIEYLWEVVWETVRLELYRNLPSRLHSISYYQDIGNAMRYCQFGRDNTHIVLSVTPDKQCRQFDENWFKQITTSSNYDEVTELAKGYWSGKMTPNRIIEVLVTGKYEFQRSEY